jgi:PAS domain S-box-containing protein
MNPPHDAASKKLRAENEELRRRLGEAEDALRAIREGDVDAVIVSGSKGDRVFSLAESENLHRLMVETMNEAGIATSLDGTILYCNQRACALLQRSTSELMGHHVSEIVAMHHLDRVSLLLDNATRGTTNDRVMFLAADESPVPMQVWASRAETFEGPMISLVGTDLSLLEADQALFAHLEEQQKALQAREHELLVAHDRLAADLDVMSSLQRIATRYVRGEEDYSIAAEALEAAIRVSDALSGDVQLLDRDTDKHVFAVHRGFEPWRVEFWQAHLDSAESACGAAWHSGQQVIIEDVDTSGLFDGETLAAHQRAGVRAVLSTPMMSGTGRVTGVLTVHFSTVGTPETRALRWIDLIARETGDIMDRYNTERQRDVLVRELEETQQRLQESHLDLEVKVKERTTLSEERAEKLRTMADALTTAEQDERRRLAQLLHDDLQQMLVAIRLRLSSLETLVAGTSLSPAVHGINEIVDNAMTSARSLTVELSPPVLREPLTAIIEWLGRWFESRHGVVVQVSGESGVRDPSEEAKKFIFQAVRELILNVRKHAGTGQARVHISASDDAVCIEVRDDGRGFDTAQVQGSDRASFGLFSIRERVELMGGSLAIESSPGSGTVCMLRVPAYNGAGKAPAAVDNAVTAEIDSRGGPIRVLVVDDHTIFRRGLISILESYPDIKVVGEASDGEQGIAHANDLMPDVVIMDLAMPRMNGIEATRIIKSRLMSVDVIALSFQESEHARASILQAGARAYFTKSGPLDDLLSAIREHKPAASHAPSPQHGSGGIPAETPVRPREVRRASPQVRDSDDETKPRSVPRTRKA